MADSEDWIPDQVDVTVASGARVYDYMIGGTHNFAADRTVASSVLQAMPDMREVATSNRAFLGRAVSYLLDQGITQFLDLGSGIPAGGNVHEVAQRRDLGTRVAYVDYDEVAVAHSRLLLRDNPLATMIEADLRRPDEVLARPEIRDLLDFDKPLGLLMLGVVHFIAEDDEARDLVDRYRRALPPGSFLALSHLTGDHKLREMASVADAMRKSRDPVYLRNHEGVVRLFDGFELVEPGVVSAPDWRPGPGAAQTASTAIYVGVGRA